MKKCKFIIGSLILSSALAISAFGLIGCGGNDSPKEDDPKPGHVHSYTITKYDDDFHWKECAEDNAQGPKSPHTLNADGKCECGYEMEVPDIVSVLAVFTGTSCEMEVKSNGTAHLNVAENFGSLSGEFTWTYDANAGKLTFTDAQNKAHVATITGKRATFNYTMSNGFVTDITCGNIGGILSAGELSENAPDSLALFENEQGTIQVEVFSDDTAVAKSGDGEKALTWQYTGSSMTFNEGENSYVVTIDGDSASFTYGGAKLQCKYMGYIAHSLPIANFISVSEGKVSNAALELYYNGDVYLDVGYRGLNEMLKWGYDGANYYLINSSGEKAMIVVGENKAATVDLNYNIMGFVNVACKLSSDDISKLPKNVTPQET